MGLHGDVPSGGVMDGVHGVHTSVRGWAAGGLYKS